MSRRIVKESRDFKGVWIPKRIWLAEDLKAMELLVLTEIDSLDNENGCTASNAYLADFFGISRQRISQIISNLKDKEYISIQYQKDGKWCKGRTIKVVNKFDGVVNKFDRGVKKIYQGCQENLTRCQENLTGCQEKLKANNTNINTDINTKRNIYESDSSLSAGTSSDHIPYSEVVEYLNEKAGTEYRATTQKTRKLIRARFNEDFTLDDFKQVIDTKTSQWLNDPKMNKYLRPETLFGTKFENYLNEKHPQLKKNTSNIDWKVDW